MHRHLPLTNRLRHSHRWGWVALWLVVLQFVAASEHLSAVAAKELGIPSSFLGLCTAQGFIPTNDGSPKNLNEACAFCVMDAMCGHAVATPPVTLPPPYLIGIGDEIRSTSFYRHGLTNLRYGAVRGPPRLSAS